MQSRTIGILLALATGVVLATGVASAQLVQQSELTFDDVDPNFRLTLDHLAMDGRWLGLSPRQVTWSPDGEWVYFRWREDPAPDQESDLDPWYAVNREGSEVRIVPEDEARRIPSGGIDWSRDRETAVWSNDGAIYVWTPEDGARVAYIASGGVDGLDLSPDGTRAYFSTEAADGPALWEYELASRRLRQAAHVVSREDEEYSDSEQWLRDQQLELFEFLQEREDDRELSDSLEAARAPAWRPQAVPIEEGEAESLQLSPNGEWVTFQWEKEPSEEHQTYYLDYITMSGQAEPEEARPKVGVEPPTEYRMGIVRVDPAVQTDSIEVVWVDDGIEKETVIHGPYWNPQGTVALVQILSLDYKDKWISRLDLETGEATVIHHEHQDAWVGGPLVGGRSRPGYLQWLPEGDAFGFVSAVSGWSMLYLGEPDGTVTQLTDGEWEVRGADLSPDGETWYLVTSREHPGEEHLYHLPARGGELVRITTGQGMHRPLVSPDGERIATLFETPRLRGDLYLLDNEPGADRLRVTKSGTDAYYRYDWAESEIITFPDPKGLPTWAEVWETPENPNGAAVVHAHGCGECAQAVDRGWGGMIYANYLLQDGYVAASVDYRGSAGYGHANRTYAYRQMGISDVDSALPLLDILAERYGVDRDRIGLYGCSYGGFFTLMSLFRHPGEYAAGVAQCSVTDWAHYNHSYTTRILNGSPAEDPEAYRRSSPIYYADGLQDALLIQHGLVDGNVQIQDVFRLAQRLIELEKDFDLVVYPIEPHGWRTESGRLDSYKRMSRWWERHLLGEVTTAVSTGR